MLNDAREYELGFRCGMSGVSGADVNPAFNRGFRDGQLVGAGFQLHKVGDLEALARGHPATEGTVIVYRNALKVWLNPYANNQTAT